MTTSSLIDIVALAALALGALRGWHNGAHWELPRLVMWLLILSLGLTAANTVGWLVRWLGFEASFSMMVAYLVAALGIAWYFALHYWGMERASETRGRDLDEQFRGVPLGILRYAMGLVVAFTLLSLQPDYSPNFATLRQNLLEQSGTGAATRFYWANPARAAEQSRQLEPTQTLSALPRPPIPVAPTSARSPIASPLAG